MKHRTRALAVVLALALCCAGCGIPTSNVAQQLPVDAGANSSTTTSTIPPGGAIHVFVYFLKGGHLIKETANVSLATQLVDQALVLLGYGPTAPEAREGVTSALSPNPRGTNSVQSISKGVATVVLDPSLTGVSGTQLVDALGQIVFTVTTNSKLTSTPASSVVFFLDGEQFYAFLPDSTITSRPVTQQDYAQIAPLSGT